MARMLDTERPALRPGVEVHAVEDGCVVYVPGSQNVHFLNATAAFVVELCDGTVTWHEMQAVFSAEIGSTPPFDVRATVLPHLEDAGIIEPAPPRSA
jgi:hypothetical protein